MRRFGWPRRTRRVRNPSRSTRSSTGIVAVRSTSNPASASRPDSFDSVSMRSWLAGTGLSASASKRSSSSIHTSKALKDSASAQVATPRAPPGRRTRWTSARPVIGSGRWNSMKAMVTASKAASPKPRREASATTRGNSGGARAIIPGARSAPTTRARGARARISARRNPTPAPRSRTRRASASGIRFRSCPRGGPPPLAGDSLEGVAPPIVEFDAGAGDKILHGRGDEHLPRPRERRDPGADVYGDSLDDSSRQLDLARMDPRPDLKADRPDRPGCRGRALDGQAWGVERRQEAVPGRVHLSTAISFELRSQQSVVALQELAPVPGADRRRSLRRTHDVSEQDRRQDAVVPRRRAGAR